MGKTVPLPKNPNVRTLVMMASDGGDSNCLFGEGFTRAAIAEEFHPAIDEAMELGLIEPVTIYCRTRKGKRFLKGR